VVFDEEVRILCGRAMGAVLEEARSGPLLSLSKVVPRLWLRWELDVESELEEVDVESVGAEEGTT